jgi:uncharacterized membrane protein YcaP (DUF421 family)
MDIVVRAALMYFFILLLTRIVGRRELSSLQPFDLVLLVVIGDLVQQGVTQSDYSFTGLMIAAGTIAILQTGVSWLGFRSDKVGLVLEGEPIVVVQDGRPIDRNIRRERVTIDDLLSAARRQNIASLDDVAWAVMETSGEITFIKKSE